MNWLESTEDDIYKQFTIYTICFHFLLAFNIDCGDILNTVSRARSLFEVANTAATIIEYIDHSAVGSLHL